MLPAEPRTPRADGDPLAPSGGGRAAPPPGAPDAAGRDVDPELLALPAPPAGRRIATVTLMALVGALAVVLLVQLAPDVRYFFAGTDAPVDLGPAIALDPATLPVGAHVRVQGMPMASTEVPFSRPFGGGRYVAFPLAGQRDLLVQARRDQGNPNADPAARRDWSGRLVTFATLGGRYRAVRERFEAMGLPVTPETFLLLADQPPSAAAPRVALAAFCLLVLALDALLLLRWFRPLRQH